MPKIMGLKMKGNPGIEKCQNSQQSSLCILHEIICSINIFVQGNCELDRKLVLCQSTCNCNIQTLTPLTHNITLHISHSIYLQFVQKIPWQPICHLNKCHGAIDYLENQVGFWWLPVFLQNQDVYEKIIALEMIMHMYNWL